MPPGCVVPMPASIKVISPRKLRIPVKFARRTWSVGCPSPKARVKRTDSGCQGIKVRRVYMAILLTFADDVRTKRVQTDTDNIHNIMPLSSPQESFQQPPTDRLPQ